MSPDADLVGIPFASGSYDINSGALDCVGLALVWYRRHGFQEAAYALEDSLRLLSPNSDWDPVAGLTEALRGDLVLSEPPTPGGGSELHVSVLTSVRPLYAISSARRLGSYLCCPYTIRNVVGIYRPPKG